MYCGNCGKMNGDVEGKAPLAYFEKNSPESVCSCSKEQLDAAKDASYHSDQLRWWDAQAARLATARTPGGIADYEKACDAAEKAKASFDAAINAARG